MPIRPAITAFIVLVVATLAVTHLGSTMAEGDTESARPPSEVGRYQAAGGDQNEVWLIDTTTGECWRAHTRGAKRAWEQLVPPLPAKPPKAPPDNL